MHVLHAIVAKVWLEVAPVVLLATAGVGLALVPFGVCAWLLRWAARERPAVPPSVGDPRNVPGLVADAFDFGAVIVALALLRDLIVQGDRIDAAPRRRANHLRLVTAPDDRPSGAFRALGRPEQAQECAPPGARCWITGRLNCDGQHPR